MNGTVKPIRSESARFLVGGTRKGQGVVLLYPDKLASVRVYAEMWGYFVGPLVVAAAAFPIVRIIGAWPEIFGALQAALGVMLGGAIGRAVDRGLAAKAVADGPEAATIIPLDMVASLQTFRPTRLGSLFSGRDPGRDDGGRHRVRVPRANGRPAERHRRRPGRARSRGPGHDNGPGGQLPSPERGRLIRRGPG